MLKKLFLISLMTAFIAFTDTPKQEKEPVVKLPVSKWVIILKGCSKLTIEEGQGVYMDIVNQINAQMQDTIKKK